MNRRRFINRSLWATGGLLLGTGIYSWQIEPFWLEFVQKKMPLKNLPEFWNNKTLMQLSDLHVGKRFDYKFLIKSMEEAKKYNPDLVVYTGDFVTSYNDSLTQEKLEEVLQYAVKGKIATVAILGNHDYGKNWSESEVADEITALLTRNGILVLRNERLLINDLQFIGIDDLWGVNYNPEKALEQYDPNLPTITLCHNPDACDDEILHSLKGWILSGHTHGGQVKAPFLPPFMLPVKNRKYSSGQIEIHQDLQLYINRAIGHLWQIRFNVRPEITLFNLANG